MAVVKVAKAAEVALLEYFHLLQHFLVEPEVVVEQEFFEQQAERVVGAGQFFLPAKKPSMK